MSSLYNIAINRKSWRGIMNCAVKNYIGGRIIFFFFFLFFSYQSLAQVTIEVRDQRTGESLAGANLEIENSDQGAVTNLEGEATLPSETSGKVRISYVGYNPKVIQLNESSTELVVYLSPDEKILSEVVVLGYENNRKLLETPGAVSLVRFKDIHRYNETSMVPAINTVPGVRMEQRSPGSYRISIRGSSLRAPFDVRNIKVYWNGIPLTDPSGRTPLNLLDLKQVDRIEVLKGPAASTFGAGTGGVINLQTEPAELGERSFSAASTVGSYGLKKIEGSWAVGNEPFNFKVNASSQSSDGYREHTEFERSAVQIFSKFKASDQRTITGNLFYSDLFYEVPGGLTAEQFQENPKQARPDGFFPGSVTQNASVDYQAFISSLTQNYRFNDNFDNATSIYLMSSFFEMPFITDFERETRQGVGGRTRFNYYNNWGNVEYKLTAGAEYQRALLVGRNFGNRAGKADTINFDDEVRSWQSLYFAQADFILPAGFIFTAGLSVNDLEYDIYRLTDAALDTSYRTTKRFEQIWAPRIGLIKKITPDIALQGSVSRGFSPPSVSEVRTGDGGLNVNLQAEKGINYEAGIRGALFESFLTFDLLAFSFQLDETIVSFTDAESNVVKFRNTGATNQNGVELSLTAFLVDQSEQWVRDLKLSTSYTYHHFRFENYIKDEVDYSGNRLTGVAPHVLVSRLDMIAKPGLYFNFTHNFTDEIPLNDENTVFSDAFNLLSFKAGWETAIASDLTMDIYLGVDNLLDETYSLGNDLNAFGNRYFQPAPDRNYFGGVKFVYNY